ncbi:MAG: polysaccharide deacetylase family protein [Magnetococcales bacterium]|nr:polysaccharide deacetylase family protein [Magnetococcales bacterium]
MTPHIVTDPPHLRPLTILLYHGVTASRPHGIENHSGKHIQVATFHEQMTLVKQHCTPLSMDEAMAINQSGADFPRHAVVISFDDGFRNNYTLAAPILAELGLPAVFYLTSGMIHTDMIFWVDRIEAAINHTRLTHLTIPLGDAHPTLPLATSAEKIQAVTRIKSFCKQAPQAERDQVLATLIAQTQVDPSADLAENYRMLTWPQVKAMDADPLFTIGGHSLYHDVLSSLPHARMLADLDLSIGLLAYGCGHPIHHYSYPEGQANHYNATIVEALQQRGIRYCPSAIHGVNPKGSDPFHLRRIMVGFQEIPFPFFPSE